MVFAHHLRTLAEQGGSSKSTHDLLFDFSSVPPRAFKLTS